MIRIAVLGCGAHRRNARRKHRSTSAGRAGWCVRYPCPAAQAVAVKTGAQVFPSAEAVFASDDVDAVLIATATDTHADLLELAVAAGKPVLCEKPIDLSLDRVNRCATTIAGSKVAIQLGFVRRFDPGHAAVRRAIAAGDIGDLHQVVITSRDPGMPPPAYTAMSGGILRDMTIHDLDMARFILGEEVIEVFATGSRLVDKVLMESWATMTP